MQTSRRRPSRCLQLDGEDDRAPQLLAYPSLRLSYDIIAGAHHGSTYAPALSGALRELWDNQRILDPERGPDCARRGTRGTRLSASSPAGRTLRARPMEALTPVVDNGLRARREETRARSLSSPRGGASDRGRETRRGVDPARENWGERSTPARGPLAGDPSADNRGVARSFRGS